MSKAEIVDELQVAARHCRGLGALLEQRRVEVDLDVELAGGALVQRFLEHRPHLGVPVVGHGRGGDAQRDLVLRHRGGRQAADQQQGGAGGEQAAAYQGGLHRRFLVVGGGSDRRGGGVRRRRRQGDQRNAVRGSGRGRAAARRLGAVPRGNGHEPARREPATCTLTCQKCDVNAARRDPAHRPRGAGPPWPPRRQAGLCGVACTSTACASGAAVSRAAPGCRDG